MKVAVLGAGAMGAVFGAAFARGGAEVTLLDANAAHVAAIAADGLQLVTDGGCETWRLPAMRPGNYRDRPDLVLLLTKSLQSDAALGAIAGSLGSAWVMSLQNGLGNVEIIARHVAEERIICGMTLMPADYLGPGRVAAHGAGPTAFYTASGAPDAILDRIAALLTAGGLSARPDPGIQRAIWEKAAFNCTLNAIAALTGRTVGGIGDSAVGRALAHEVAAEVVAVAGAAGVPARLDTVLAMLSDAFRGHRHHEPSMLQDRKAGRTTEIASLNGAVLAQAERLGVAVPVNRTLAALVGLAAPDAPAGLAPRETTSTQANETQEARP